MTLEEAIKILQLHLKLRQRVGAKDLNEPIKLGIEALKRIRLLRLISTNEDAHQLPGETT